MKGVGRRGLPTALPENIKLAVASSENLNMECLQRFCLEKRKEGETG